jgi:predicted ATPase
MRGEVLLAQDKAAAADSFERALSIARLQSAKLWELRASVSLARLWCDQGRRDDARNLLAPVYGWFTEGSPRPICKRPRNCSTFFVALSCTH